MLAGKFPHYLVDEFAEMLEYFGQSPIIVRSSSLLEDNYGNAFAGKYESVFCANQGPHAKRLEDFLSAVKTIYASTMSEKALRYRAQRGLLDRDEQMSLLVQRVSGACYGNLFFPQIAGVGPLAQSLRLERVHRSRRRRRATGVRAGHAGGRPLGRRLHPHRRPQRARSPPRRRSRTRPAVLPAQGRCDRSGGEPFGLAEFRRCGCRLSGASAAHFHFQRRRRLAEMEGFGETRRARPILFSPSRSCFRKRSFVGDMRRMLQVLQTAYDYPVDIEFTANFFRARIATRSTSCSAGPCRSAPTAERSSCPKPSPATIAFSKPTAP